MAKILVVDDSRLFRQMTADLLRQQGHEVSTAPDGLSAIAHIQSARPDLVILDVVMPNMSGFEVCRRIKAQPETQAIHVLLYTANTDPASRYWGLRQGADAYLVKPVAADVLLDSIQNLLS
ncbi:response regulator [Trichothermofontia sp.]